MAYTAWKIDVDQWRTICADIRDRINPRILVVGDLLTSSEFDPDGDDQQTLDDYTLALDAHAAAGALADEAEHPPDLAGVLVLLDIAASRFTAALDRHAGRPVAARVFRCVENPLHGPAVNVPKGIADLRDWRPRRSKSRGYPHCAECLRRQRDRDGVDWLPAPISDPGAGRSGTILAVPYFEIVCPRTAWAATGYGNIRGEIDLRVSGYRRR
ncbi:MAG: hypothetical protein JF587_03050 [Catenulisporales bacterium]|nr:hypothetical protein [Catenulisporales bacterium]